MLVESKLREYITANFLFGDASQLGNEDSFLDKGIIDSTGILEIIMYLEEEFGIKVNDNEMLPENLDSIANITRFVERKSPK